MDLILETHGTRVSKVQGMLQIIVPGKEKVEVPIREVESILIGANVSLTTQVLKSLSAKGVNIIYTSFGKAYGLYTPFATVGTVHTRRQQLKAYEDWRGKHIAMQIVRAAMENKRRLLLYLAKGRKTTNPGLTVRLRAAAKKIERLIGELQQGTSLLKKGESLNAIRAKLMGLEGRAAAIYFIEYANIFPEGFKTLTRSRRPPRNPLNSLLSLGYMIILSHVTTAILATGLELYGGFLHSDRSGKPSLALDLIEEFRQPIVDRLVARLVNKGQIKVEDFETSLHGYKLKDHVKNFFYSELTKEINGKEPTRELFGDFTRKEKRSGHVKMNFKREMLKQARKLARYLIGSENQYEPYLMNW
ncbi:MAG: CRISPR-associated endonuclease Cas1 [Promethearchaeota archaeon]